LIAQLSLPALLRGGVSISNATVEFSSVAPKASRQVDVQGIQVEGAYLF
jgi:hypothetical protein